uniref:AlNc14C7G943 protein n=1 Tax=Albugo laibachii Nc14 TaxID=890382 RepID=F0W1H5_9STRA|nr:AlNc14C7G943 [Albugo laibachii Nc14]|eukprot:CCA14904.1 AlNc14C7G943 [Albugo laibachii Nc14]
MLSLSELFKLIKGISSWNTDARNQKKHKSSQMHLFSTIEQPEVTVLREKDKITKKKHSIPRSIRARTPGKNELCTSGSIIESYLHNQLNRWRKTGISESLMTFRLGDVETKLQSIGSIRKSYVRAMSKVSPRGITMGNGLLFRIFLAEFSDGRIKFIVRYRGIWYYGVIEMAIAKHTMRCLQERENFGQITVIYPAMSVVDRPFCIGSSQTGVTSKNRIPVECDEIRRICERQHEESVIDEQLAIIESAGINKTFVQAVSDASVEVKSTQRITRFSFDDIYGERKREGTTSTVNRLECELESSTNKRRRLSPPNETLHRVTSSSTFTKEKHASPMIIDLTMPDRRQIRDGSPTGSQPATKYPHVYWHLTNANNTFRKRPSERYRHLLPPLRKRYVKHLSGKITWTA